MEIQKENNLKFLDTLDFLKYIFKSKDVKDIMTMAQTQYDCSDKLPRELNGDLFRFISIEEFAHYLSKRYCYRIHENTYTQYILYNDCSNSYFI